MPDFSVHHPQLKTKLNEAAKALGFTGVGISRMALSKDEAYLDHWLEHDYHGEMEYMARHGRKRSRPELLIPGTLSIISLRMDYWPQHAKEAWTVLNDDALGYVSRYALGRDYHKTIRKHLAQLADWLANEIGEFGYRVFTDSAPVLERALARNAGLGFIGKNTCLIHPKEGSLFFLGEIFTDVPLPEDEVFDTEHCGSCQQCMDVCPTDAIVAPNQLDARRCISYLTIELHGSIPEPMRSLIGNRIYGCDDCQLICPWNKFAERASHPDFTIRHRLDQQRLVDLFAWTEAEFLKRTEGTAIRRIGYHRWLRNIAVALGNATPSDAIKAALRNKADNENEMVREHVQWALKQLASHKNQRQPNKPLPPKLAEKNL